MSGQIYDPRADMDGKVIRRRRVILYSSYKHASTGLTNSITNDCRPIAIAAWSIVCRI